MRNDVPYMAYHIRIQANECDRVQPSINWKKSDVWNWVYNLLLSQYIPMYWDYITVNGVSFSLTNFSASSFLILFLWNFAHMLFSTRAHRSYLFWRQLCSFPWLFRDFRAKSAKIELKTTRRDSYMRTRILSSWSFDRAKMTVFVALVTCINWTQ